MFAPGDLAHVINGTYANDISYYLDPIRRQIFEKRWLVHPSNVVLVVGLNHSPKLATVRPAVEALVLDELGRLGWVFLDQMEEV